MVSLAMAISPSWAILGGSALFAFAAYKVMTAIGTSTVSSERMQRAFVLLSGWGRQLQGYNSTQKQFDRGWEAVWVLVWQTAY